MTEAQPVPTRPPLATAVAMVAELGWRELRRRPWAAGAASAAGTFAGLALTRPGSHPMSSVRIAEVLLVVAGAALAGATDPATRHDADLLVRIGCPRLVVRAASWVAAVAPLAASASAGVVVGATVVDGNRSVDGIDALIAAVVLPALGAWTTAGVRLPDPSTVTGDRTLERGRRTRTVARLLAGTSLVVIGGLAPTGAASGSDLDLVLPLGTVLVLAGFVLVIPSLTAGASAAVERFPSVVLPLAASSVRRQRRGLVLPIATVAGVALLLLVQTVLGTALGRREADRVAALAALGPATRAGSPDVAVASAASFYEPASGDGSTEAPDLEEIRRVAPGTMVAGTRRVRLEPRSASSTFGSISRVHTFEREDAGTVEVAVATPELLGALHLPASLATARSALVLDPRVLRSDGTVALDHPRTKGSVRTYRLPARGVGGPGIPVDLPSVLLPEAIVPTGLHDRPGVIAVVRFPHRPTDEQVSLLEGVAKRVVRGDERVDLAGTHRTDVVASIWVRDREGADRLLVALGILAVGAIGIGLLGVSSAVRHEDDLLRWLGSRTRLRALVGATRGALVGAIGTALGAAVGAVALKTGLDEYDAHGRFAARDPLASLPFHVPGPAIVALLALPLVSAAFSAALAAAPRASRQAVLLRAEQRSA